MVTEHIRCPPPEADSPYDIVHFLCGDKDKTELSVMCYDKWFEIPALAKILDSCPVIKADFLRLLDDLLSMDADNFEFNLDNPDTMEEIDNTGGILQRSDNSLDHSGD
ncbi:hypothetical protein CPSG_02599 [Coccidioides posadasii str. Silveira]|uniref:Uncharacterized protein n=1 Tax=Coccidioides posadasii (strain RMSCC 757 / Silveira) TaxID=443226 RepID=E9CXS9_COCPS|nr:hypothetical protein CPSG_02599 [Coccidioides posadasii str. Silveira]